MAELLVQGSRVLMNDNQKTLDLRGEWRFSLDPENRGDAEQWWNKILDGRVFLPGTLDENGIGEENKSIDLHRLNRVRRYLGAAWYQREIVIPEEWGNDEICLKLERVLWKSRVWWDDEFIGEGESLCTPHRFCLPKRVVPGKHRLTLCIDNSSLYKIGIRSHGYSEDMQTIWNGVLGEISLTPYHAVSMVSARVYPDIQRQSACFKLTFRNDCQSPILIRYTLEVASLEKQTGYFQESHSLELPIGLFEHEVDLQLGDQMRMWDEWNPSLFQGRVCTLESERSQRQEYFFTFGLREFTAKGSEFEINGKKVFLRGTHEAGLDAFKGYPPMTVEEWSRIYQIGLLYGLNHFRFHSYCPPKAAFIAADKAGIYLQVELPIFSISAPAIGEDQALDQFLRRELDRILMEYGEHPSFCIMCMGNELRGDYGILEGWIREGKKIDSHHLYTTSANNSAEPSLGKGPHPADDCFISQGEIREGNRLLRRCEDLFHLKPETEGDYRQTLLDIAIPTISHEVGQWEMYPDYSEIPKYTGILRAKNYELFEESLNKNGMGDLAERFTQATGRFLVILYREEIERSLRTPKYGGFQLLDIRDYMGQGGSPVGWLNSFWEPKGFIDDQSLSRSCSPVAILLRIPSRVWTSSEALSGTVEVSNFGGRDLENILLEWRLLDSHGKIIKTGELESKLAPHGSLTKMGEIFAELHFVRKSEQFTLEIESNCGKWINDWKIWVYVEEEVRTPSSKILVTEEWNDAVEKKLEEGGIVFFLSRHLGNSEPLRFTLPFWNTLLFSGQIKSMGIYCNPEHPALKGFPTDFHSNWQWWELTQGARALNLSSFPAEMRPIIHVIDHPVRNQKQGAFLEAQVGAGRICVCTLNLDDRGKMFPARRQLWNSIIDYLEGSDFKPRFEFSSTFLKECLRPASTNWLCENITDLRASSAWWDSPVKNVIDGEKSSCWKSQRNIPFPHIIEGELKNETGILGFRYGHRADGLLEGNVRGYEFYVRKSGESWGKPIAQGEFPCEEGEVEVQFDYNNDGFNITRCKVGSFFRLVLISSHAEGMLASIGSFDLVVTS